MEKNQLFGFLCWSPKLKAKEVGYCHFLKQNRPECSQWDVRNQGTLATIWDSFSETHCPLPMRGVLN
jgi:hypothetical protein